MEFLNAFLSPEFTQPLFLTLLLVLNNILVCKWMTRNHSNVLQRVKHAHSAERVRATETINALRGIIYAFKDAQQLESLDLERQRQQAEDRQI